jgi:PAS domain S-box-containing protein
MLEDRAADAELLLHALRRAGFEPHGARVETEPEYLAHLQAGLDVIFADYALPQFDALRALHLLQERDLDIPFIIVSGTISEEVAVESMKQGAADYLLKDRLGRLGQAVAQTLEKKRLRDERRHTEAALRDSEASFRLLFTDNPHPMWVFDLDTFEFLEVNDTAVMRYGYSRDEFLGMRITDIRPSGDIPRLREVVQQERSPLRSFGQWRHRLKDGRIIDVDVTSHTLTFGGRRAALVVAQDITERKQAEQALQAKNDELRVISAQLWQAAKLATMGELAASIAHELNNPLATVSLRVESLLARASADDPGRHALEIIEQEVERMGTLVANLLQFSRRSTPQISSVDVREELDNTLALIHYHLRNHRITVVREFAPDVPLIHVDRQQLRQVFLNLLTNASDAMPQGGTLTLQVAAAVLDTGAPAVQIAFRDTGVGIAPADLPKVGEPFFTTKAEGKGTGLGLAICKRIVHEHHGTFEITSDLGQGTTVRLTLPLTNGTNGAFLQDTSA